MEATKVHHNSRDNCYTFKYCDPISGKWKTKFVPSVIKTESDAIIWADSFKLSLEAKKQVPSNAEVAAPVHTVKTLLPLWEEYLWNVKTNREGDKLDESTIKGWIGKVRNYAADKPIGSIPLTAEKFTAHAVLAWVEWLKTLGMAKYTLKDTVASLRTMIADARKKNWAPGLVHNPVADEIVRSEIPVGETRAGKNNPIHLTADDTRALLTCSSYSIPPYRKVKNVVALCTGMRSAELQGLCWSQVNLAKGYIDVSRQLKKGGEHPVFGPPKKKSFREIPLHPLAAHALAFWKKQAKKTGPDAPVFPDPKTGLYCKANAARSFRDDLQASGLSTQYQGKYNIDQHATRRTFLTLLSDAGVSDELASTLAGHSKRGVRRHYVKDNMRKFIPAIASLPFDGVTLGWVS